MALTWLAVSAVFTGVLYNFSPSRPVAVPDESALLGEVTAFDKETVDGVRDGTLADAAAAVRQVERRYREFSRRFPRNSDAYNFLGGFFYDMGLPERAYREWRAGLRVNRADAHLYNNLAEYYAHDTGRHRQAIEMVRRAIRLDAGVAVFHFNLGTYYDVFRNVVLVDYGSLDAVYAACLAAHRRAVELAPESYENAYVYALTITHSPRIWGIENPSSQSEMIAAWRYCLPLAPHEAATAFIRRQLERLGAS